jgi:hypothetical protein
MGPDYDNNWYPYVKPVPVEEYMRSVSMENLSQAPFRGNPKQIAVEVVA